jgi:hypothetical protein
LEAEDGSLLQGFEELLAAFFQVVAGRPNARQTGISP